MLDRQIPGQHLPLVKAKLATDAYRSTLDLDPDFTYDVQELIDKLDFEQEWESREHVDWYTQDTIFFSLT